MSTPRVRILCNKTELEILVRERNPDILCVSETWLLSETPDEFVNNFS